MRFYIDFENVNAGGLKGIESLKADDAVIIYYSNNPNLSMETVQKMIQSKAKIEFQKLSDEIKNMNLKNALDIVILNDIARISGKKEQIAVITNDCGYDAMIHKFAENGRNVKRAVSISKVSAPVVSKQPTAGNSKINEQEIAALFKKELSSFASDKQKILNIIKNSKTRSQINNKLTKAFSNNTGKIMKAIKPYIKNLPGK